MFRSHHDIKLLRLAFMAAVSRERKTRREGVGSEWKFQSPRRWHRLALRELEAAARSPLAVLLALLHPAVAGEEAGVTERDFEAVVEPGQRAAEAHDDSPGLSRRSAPVRVHQDVHLAAGVRHLQRAEDRLAVALAREVFVERAAVDLNAAGPGRHADARDGGLPPADAPDVAGLRGR